MTFEFKPIPKKGLSFNVKGITNALRQALEEEGAEHRKLLRATTRTWKGTKPQFRTKTVVSPTRLFVETEPYGQGHGAEKWWWLEMGTRIRWAVMSNNWRSKTRSAKLRSSIGRGKVVIAGKRAMTARNIRPRPGIEARNWRAEVVRMRSRKFKGQLQRVFKITAENWIQPKALRR